MAWAGTHAPVPVCILVRWVLAGVHGCQSVHKHRCLRAPVRVRALVDVREHTYRDAAQRTCARMRVVGTGVGVPGRTCPTGREYGLKLSGGVAEGGCMLETRFGVIWKAEEAPALISSPKNTNQASVSVKELSATPY
ncbi:hypothetical protein GGX14DRAFT_405436 [Mycena pura]|uniref:Secreted protein n=1 Tax=Mycena pura TaxID=153505 RepID=A0AAD6US93_9AGAR|nr:hypothetical protein GGX14DRAFT_405436 [Mycena pura]